MHLYLVARGAEDRINRWCNDLLAHYCPFEPEENVRKATQLMGKPTEKFKVQVSVRPIRLYEVVFPESSYKAILETIYPYGYMDDGLKAATWAFRKMIKTEPILPEKMIKPSGTLVRDWVDVVSLGVRKDKYIKGIEQL